MSNNCLVTKLKGSVDNPNLPTLGEMVLVVDSKDSTQGMNYFGVSHSRPLHIICTNGGSVVNWGSDFTLEAGEHPLNLTPGHYEIKIIGKYSINGLGLGGYVRMKTIEDLAYLESPLSLTPFSSVFAISGDIGSLAVRQDYSINVLSSNLFSFGNDVYGSIANLKKFNLSGQKTLRFFDSKLSGDISIFASLNSDWKQNLIVISTLQYSVGKISGNIEAFKDYTNMQGFDLNYVATTGNMAEAFGHMTNISGIAIGGHTEAQDAKEFLDALYTNGKRSGNVQCWLGSNKTITYNGETVPFVNGSIITFTANGWTYPGA